MKLRKNLGRLATAFVATAMLASVAAVPASAANYSGTSISYNKIINMENAVGAYVPKVTYKYSIAAGDAINAVEGVSPEIKAGTFTQGTDGKQYPNITTDVTFNQESLSEDKKTASEPVTIDFSQASYAAPGIYRYVISETDAEAVGLATVDDDDTIYLDVYVTENSGVRSITYYQLSTSADAPTIGDSDPDNEKVDDIAQYEGKFTASTDTYTTFDVTITKNVAGDMGDKGKEFNFDIDITDPNSSSVLESVTVENGTSKGNFTQDEESQKYIANVIADLHDKESVVIKGVPTGTVLNITETNATGYTVAYSANAEDGQATITDDTTITVTNTLNSITPTGLVMNVAPYALLVVVAAGACFVFLRKRRED